MKAIVEAAMTWECPECNRRNLHFLRGEWDKFIRSYDKMDWHISFDFDVRTVVYESCEEEFEKG